MSDDLTDRLRSRGHRECEDCWYSCPLSREGCCDDARPKECDCGYIDDHRAADEIDRLRQGVKVYGEALGNTQRSLERADATIAALLATIAALLARTTNCARNLRNIGEAHAEGDDPIIDGIILDSGVVPEASMSSLFIAAADALDASGLLWWRESSEALHLRGRAMSDDLTDRLRQWEHIPLALDAADEIDRLKGTIAALLAVPDEMRATNKRMAGPLESSVLADVDARMAAVVEGERNG